MISGFNSTYRVRSTYRLDPRLTILDSHIAKSSVKLRRTPQVAGSKPGTEGGGSQCGEANKIAARHEVPRFVVAQTGVGWCARPR
jgi:hypothetical protein